MATKPIHDETLTLAVATPQSAAAAWLVVAAGTPEDVVKVKRSYTGQFLAPVLARRGAGAGKKKRIEAAE